MARSTRSSAAERAYSQFAPSAAAAHGFGAVAATCPRGGDEFDESDIWGSFDVPAAAVQPRAADVSSPRALRAVPAAARPGRNKAKPGAAAGAGAGSAHGSLPVNIPDWSKILGDEYRAHNAGDWELDDVDDEDVDSAASVVPPHELAWRRRAASLSVHGAGGMGIGRTLKVRDAVWKQTGFQA